MKRKARGGWFATVLFTVISIFYVAPLFIVLINSFKKKAFINLEPFKLPSEKTWVALENAPWRSTTSWSPSSGPW